MTIPELTRRNAPVVSIHAPRAEEPEPVAAEAAAVPAEGAVPAAPAAPARLPVLRAPLPPRALHRGCGGAGGRCQEGRRQEGGRSGQEGRRQEVAAATRARAGRLCSREAAGALFR